MRSVPKWAVAAVCFYEVVAITTGRAPTITTLCGRLPWLAPGLILALAVHLAGQPRAPVPDDCPVAI